MSVFEELEADHRNLLEWQAGGKDIFGDVEAYIGEVRQKSSQVSSPLERDQLRAILRYWAGYIFDHSNSGTYPNTSLTPFTGKQGFFDRLAKNDNRFLLFLGTITILALCVLIFVFVPGIGINPWRSTPSLTSSPLSIPTLSPRVCDGRTLYGFDSGTMGWKARNTKENQAVRQARPSESSLELQVDLRGDDEDKSKGEAYVNLDSNPPLGLDAPLDLEGESITIWVYVPKEAVGGDPKRPNGVQVFVKDRDFNSVYGKWENLTSDNTDIWTFVTLTQTIDLSWADDIGSGFDPFHVIEIGIKIGTGKDPTTRFEGSIWIDEVCRQKPQIDLK